MGLRPFPCDLSEFEVGSFVIRRRHTTVPIDAKKKETVTGLVSVVFHSGWGWYDSAYQAGSANGVVRFPKGSFWGMMGEDSQHQIHHGFQLTDSSQRAWAWACHRAVDPERSSNPANIQINNIYESILFHCQINQYLWIDPLHTTW